MTLHVRTIVHTIMNIIIAKQVIKCIIFITAYTQIDKFDTREAYLNTITNETQVFQPLDPRWQRFQRYEQSTKQLEHTQQHHNQHKHHMVQLTMETTKMIAMKRFAIPTTLVPALIPNAMETALMFVITTNRK